MGPAPRFSIEEGLALRAEYEESLASIDGLAKKYQVGYGMVRLAILRAGGKFRPRAEACARAARLRKGIVTEANRRAGVARRIPAHFEPLILSLYAEGNGAPVIAREFEINKITVYNVLKRHGIERRSLTDARRKYALNESAFDVPSPARNYWVGFMMADGNVCQGVTVSFTPRIALQLAEKDSAHVEAFRAFLGSGHPVRVHPPCGFATTQWYASFVAPSHRLAAALSTFGVVPNKSKTACVIGLENDRDFWRGVVDGDGSISFSKDTGLPILQLVGSNALMMQFAAYCETITCRTSAKVHDHKSIWGYSLSGRPAQDVIWALYENAEVGLPRKMLSAERAMQWKPRQRSWDDLPDLPALEALIVAHGNLRKVADLLGTSYGSLRVYRRYLRRVGGLPLLGKPAPPSLRGKISAEDLQDLRNKLGKWSAVARHLGIHETTMSKLIRDVGISPYRDWSHLTLESLDQMKSEYGTWAAVAGSLGMSPVSLTGLRHRLFNHRLKEPLA